MTFPRLPLAVRHRPFALAMLVVAIAGALALYVLSPRNVVTLREDGFHPRALTIDGSVLGVLGIMPGMPKFAYI